MGTINRGTALSLSAIGRGFNNGRILDGRTTVIVNGRGQVAFAPNDVEPFSGSRWLARPDPAHPNISQQIVLECLGHIDGPRFLDGNTIDGTVGLAPSTEGVFSGTHWEFIDAGSDQIQLRCLGASTQGKNARFLRGAFGQVDLAPTPGEGTNWQVIHSQPQPRGGPGETTAISDNSPCLAFVAAGIGGAPAICMAWRASDPDNNGRISLMADILSSQPFTVSLAHMCIDRPALSVDQATFGRSSSGRIFLAWTSPDQSMHVMSSADGLVFSGLVDIPGKSAFGPAIAAVNGTPIVAWTEAGSGELKTMKLGGPVNSTGETSSAAPALVFIPEFSDQPVLVAWTGTNPERTLNLAASSGGGVPTNGQKVSFASDGPTAATSFVGPALCFKQGFQAALAVIGWVGLPGGPDHDNHPNIMFSGNFSLFDDRQTFAPVTAAAPSIVDATLSADGKVFVAWVDKNSRRIITASSGTNALPTIPA